MITLIVITVLFALVLLDMRLVIRKHREEIEELKLRVQLLEATENDRRKVVWKMETL